METYFVLEVNGAMEEQEYITGSRAVFIHITCLVGIVEDVKEVLLYYNCL